MAIAEELFADGVAGVGLVGGMVRLDFVSLSSADQDAEGKPLMTFRQRVVMPPDGFLRAFVAMQNLVQQLEQAGLVVKNQASTATDPSAAGRLPASPAPKTPNFS